MGASVRGDQAGVQECGGTLTDNKLMNAGLCCSECGRPFENRENAGMWVGIDRLFVDGQFVKMSIRELQVMKELIKAYPNLIQQNTLFNKVWGVGSDCFDKILQVYMVRIRKKIPQVNLRIETIYGVGYKLVKL